MHFVTHTHTLTVQQEDPEQSCLVCFVFILLYPLLSVSFFPQFRASHVHGNSENVHDGVETVLCLSGNPPMRHLDGRDGGIDEGREGGRPLFYTEAV